MLDWIRTFGANIRIICSKCGRENWVSEFGSAYCSGCGAKLK